MATSPLCSLLCFVLLASVCLASAKTSPNTLKAAPTTDELYGILTIVGGENTETIVLTVSIDIDSGSVNTLVTNFIYAGSSLTYDGISAFDDKKQNLYYATDGSSAFIYSANVNGKRLNPPIDIGAADIFDLKMDSNSDTLYVAFLDSTDSALIATYSTNGGPAAYVANLTEVLLTEGASLGQSAIDPVHALWYFISYTQSGAYINTLSLANLTVTSNPIADTCRPSYAFLFTNPTEQLYGITGEIRAGKLHYGIATLDASGSCTETPITHEPSGIITAFTYSPYSNNLYYALVADSGGIYVCYNQVPLTGTPTCTNIGSTVISDLEVAYPK